MRFAPQPFDASSRISRTASDERQGAWLDGIASAFLDFEGVPAEVLGDNARCLVLGRDRTAQTVPSTPPMSRSAATGASSPGPVRRTALARVLDTLLKEEVGAKQRKRVAMGIQIAHFPTVKTLDDFDFKFQPSVDQKLVRELAVGRYIAQAENVLVFGPPGVGKTHLAIALGRAAVEAGYSVLFTSATALLAALSKAETEGQLGERLAFYCKPKLLIVDELGYLPFEKRSAHLFVQLVARRYEKSN
jgi:DNA replication protein DnaC